MQQAAFDACRIQAAYEAIEATSAAATFARLVEQHYSGWSVTTPLKEEAVACIDRLTAAASRAQAVNAVRVDEGELVGHNTDGAGFVRAILELWTADALRGPVLVLGSGPAARAIVLELRETGVERLYCWSRNKERARSLAPLPCEAARLIVAALPADAEVPAPVMQFAQAAEMVFDLNYGARRSPVASIRAPKRSDGLPLLLHQGILSFEWWTGRAAPAEAMRSALYAPESAEPIE